MRAGTSEQHVTRIELRTAILDLDDVIGVDALAWSVRTFAVPILASLAALAFDLGHKSAPFAREVERIALLGRQRRGACVEFDHA